MDDLSGLEWTDSNPTTAHQKPPPFGSSYPTLRPIPPLSGSSTPAAVHPSASSNKTLAGLAARSNYPTPANDIFANLVSFNTAQSTKNLSLQKEQQLLQEQREKAAGPRKRPKDASSGAEGDIWEKLGDWKATSSHVTAPPSYAATNEYGGHKLSKAINEPFANIGQAPTPLTTRTLGNDGDDLLSAFNASAPVDNSSYLPAPSRHSAGKDMLSIHMNNPKSTALGKVDTTNGSTADDDDDPFGLGTGHAPRPTEKQAAITADDDNVLGPLARPVSEFARKESTPEPSPEPSNLNTSGPIDHALAELVDMGFPPGKSREALRSTESGTDVQAAVGWLLNQAHEESKKTRTQPRQDQDNQRRDSKVLEPRRTRRRSGDQQADAPVPAWMRGQAHTYAGQRRQDSRSPVNGDKDPAKIAAELGNNLFKTANSLWKTGTKKLNQAVSELNSDSDSSQPKWMRDASLESTNRKPSGLQEERKVDSQNTAPPKVQQRTPTAKVPSVTDEALMLESQDARPVPRKFAGRPKQNVPAWSTESSRDPSPAIGTRPRDQIPSQPRFTQKSTAPDPRTKLTRQAVEEQSSQAYISPARRKKATPKPPSPEPDLLFDASQATANSVPSKLRPKSNTLTEPRMPSKSSLPTRPLPPKRLIPSILDSTLQSSTISRRSGTAAFKRGDYAEATTYYTSALSSLPQTHPLTIVLLTNRALAHLKTGDPKSCIADATAAITLIGPSHGLSETVDLGDEGSKDMNGFWSKAMTRQAEALEQLERWSEAATVWKTCVEAGIGGANTIAGRNRCEKAAGGTFSKPTSTPRPPALKKTAPKPTPKPSALDELTSGPSPTDCAEAVTRLRAANAEAERLDDEKFALSDKVSERVAKWKGGKEANLRALLASLETVLWEGSGWKKVGMGELIVPGRVKVVYMKGIARVHPDKVGFPPTPCCCYILGWGACFADAKDIATHHGHNRAENDLGRCVCNAK